MVNANTSKKEEIDKGLESEIIVGDLLNAWPIYLLTILLALIITLMYFFALEKCALLMIKLMIGLFSAILLLIGFLLLMSYFNILKDPNSKPDEEKPYLIGAIIVWVILAIIICIVACTWSRIKFSAAIIQATADYVTDIKKIFFIPIVFFFVVLTVLALWIYGAIYLFTSGELEHDPTIPFGRIKWNGTTK